MMDAWTPGDVRRFLNCLDAIRRELTAIRKELLLKDDKEEQSEGED